jgi:transposase
MTLSLPIKVSICRTVLKSALTQFWCSLGTCGTFAGIEDKSVISRKPILRSEQRDASPRVQDRPGLDQHADGQDSAICPGCQSVSRSRGSRYRRSLQDLPIQGTPVILRVHVGRRRCRKVASGESFAERPLNVCAPHARQTKRSDEIIAVVGRALGDVPVST